MNFAVVVVRPYGAFLIGKSKKVCAREREIKCVEMTVGENERRRQVCVRDIQRMRDRDTK